MLLRAATETWLTHFNALFLSNRKRRRTRDSGACIAARGQSALGCVLEHSCAAVAFASADERELAMHDLEPRARRAGVDAGVGGGVDAKGKSRKSEQTQQHGQWSHLHVRR